MALGGYVLWEGARQGDIEKKAHDDFTRDSDGTLRHFYSAHPRMAGDIQERGIDLMVRCSTFSI
jgi:hypothetical protein